MWIESSLGPIIAWGFSLKFRYNLYITCNFWCTFLQLSSEYWKLACVVFHCHDTFNWLQCLVQTDTRLAPSKWEMQLLCNDISHWLHISLKSATLYRKSFHHLKFHQQSIPVRLCSMELMCITMELLPLGCTKVLFTPLRAWPVLLHYLRACYMLITSTLWLPALSIHGDHIIILPLKKS